jgi:hypothetical protein
MSGFSVVVMMRETPDVVRRFVDYYRGLGADEIFIYFNGPAEELPDGIPARCTICTPAFWDRQGGTPPDTIEGRQQICYRHCYGRCRSPWLLVVDADEFVFGDRPLRPLLAAIPPTVESIRFPTAEAVWGPGDDPNEAFGCTYFRTQWRDRRLWRIFGPLIYGRTSAYMRRGMMGHAWGKHIVRSGLSGIEVTAHVATRNGASVTVPAASVSDAFKGFHTGHFDAISLPRWERKWQYRLEKEIVAAEMTPQRRRQMRAIRRSLIAGSARWVFERFYGISARQLRALSLFGGGFRRPGFFAAAEPASPTAETEPMPRTLSAAAASGS